MNLKGIHAWPGVWIMRLLGRMPLPVSRRLVRPLAGPMRLLMRRRRRIAERNLALCFPDESAAWRRDVLARHFVHLAEALAETGWSWAGPLHVPDEVGTLEGIEHLHAARAGGRGVLLVTGHSTCLELGGRILGAHADLAAIYRPLRNPVLERFQNAGRARYAGTMIRREDMRAAVRWLRRGGGIWYAPDQDFGLARSVFAPFFCHPAATLRGMLELARLGRARILPLYPLKDEATGRVRVIIQPPFQDMPSGDNAADLARYNAFLEHMIRQSPAQYWWLHRRFKTRPEGVPDPYRPAGD